MINILDWNLDQKLASLRIYQYITKNGYKNIKLKPCNTRVDRIDRSRPQSWKISSLKEKNDVHLFKEGWKKKIWSNIHGILKLMYEGNRKELEYALHYRDKFTKLTKQNK